MIDSVGFGKARGIGGGESVEGAVCLASGLWVGKDGRSSSGVLKLC